MRGAFDSSTDRRPSGRIAALESIRGVAAFQVLLLHAFSAFAPALVFPDAATPASRIVRFSPLFLVYDGYSAVYVFFVLSGFVLTPLFARACGRPLSALASRWARLAIPAFAAALVALAIRVAAADAPAEAARAAGSPWLARVWNPPGGAGYFLYDALVQAPFTGYAQTSLLHQLGLPIVFHRIERAYVSPFWTLSVEMQGSILVLVMSMAARLDRRLWAISVLMLGGLLVRTDFVCFLAGHLLAQPLTQGRLKAAPGFLLAALAGLGAALCVFEESAIGGRLASCAERGLDWLPCSGHGLKMAGAILLFVAAIGSAAVANVLAWRPLAALGRLSFPLYLVHWPIVVGVSSAVCAAAAGSPARPAAGVLAIVASVAVSLWCARLFAPIDARAIAISRRIRDARRSSPEFPALPLPAARPD